MDLCNQISPQGRMDSTVACDPALPGKARRPKRDVVMTFAAAIIAAMSRMARTVVAHLQHIWLERRFEFLPDVVCP